MSEPDLSAEIAAAKAYEEFFVPVLFGAWAPWVDLSAHLVSGTKSSDG
jgi:hypothetical protein